MKYKLFIIVVLLSVLGLSCDSNLYYFANEKASVTVGNADIDVAYIQDNCGYVKSQYEIKIANNEALSEADRYRYASSIFACTGYNVTKNLKLLVTAGQPTDPFDLVFSLMGVSLVYQMKIDELKREYNVAIDQCSFAKSDNFKLLCGFMATADNVVVISEIVLSALSTTELVPSQKGIETLLKANAVEVGALQLLIDGLAANDPRYMANLTRNYFSTVEAVDIINRSLPNTSLGNSLSDLNSDLLDEATQRVTSNFLALKLYSLFKLDTVTP